MCLCEFIEIESPTGVQMFDWTFVFQLSAKFVVFTVPVPNYRQYSWVIHRFTESQVFGIL